MQDIKKLVRMSTGMDLKKTVSLEKSEPPHELCESCIIGKQHHTPSRIVKRMDPFKRATQNGELSHGDIAGGGKIVRTLGGARYVFALTDDKTDMTEIHLLKKKSETFPQLKKFDTKSMQREFNSTAPEPGLPNNQWGKAISTAVYLENRSPTKSLKGITPMTLE